MMENALPRRIVKNGVENMLKGQEFMPPTLGFFYGCRKSELEFFVDHLCFFHAAL
jgi:hypothetical protein